jgi:hypothetical protein
MIRKVFISYSTKDAQVANAVCKALEADDVRCWIAPRDILPGEEYADAIIEALNTCQLFLVILSDESNSSPQVRREVERAVSKDLSILTFRIDNTILSKAMEYYLSNRHWLDASQAAFSKQLQNLNAAVHKLLEQGPAPIIETRIPEPVEVVELGKPETPAMEATPVKAPTPKPARIRKNNRIIWIITPILIITLAAVAYFGLAGRIDIPFFSRATETNTLFLTSTIDYISTMQAYDATSTAMAGDAWIQGFAEPILSQIANRTPDFQDDFSNPNLSSSKWNLSKGVTIENGQAVIAATNQWQSMGLTSPGSDFVAQFKLTLPKGASSTLSVDFSFRGDAFGQASNHFSLSPNGWCGFGVTRPTTNYSIVSFCKSYITTLEQTTKITIIVQGDQAAAYVNDQPMASLNSTLNSGNEISIGAGNSDGKATVGIEDVEIWNLNR